MALWWILLLSALTTPFLDKKPESILGLKFTPLGFRWNESYHIPGGEMRVHHYVWHRPFAFLRWWTPSMPSLALSLSCLSLITQRHCWSGVLSGICGPMSASACSQMAPKTLWVMLPNSDHSLSSPLRILQAVRVVSEYSILWKVPLVPLSKSR